MSKGPSISKLKTQHAELQDALETEEAKLQPNDVTVAEIKKRKLAIKDEIARLEQV